MGICLLETFNPKGRRLANLSFRRNSIHRFYQIKNIANTMRNAEDTNAEFIIPLATNLSLAPVPFQLPRVTPVGWQSVLLPPLPC